MPSLALGLVAALAWGVHDLCVRAVARRGGIVPSLATVLALGALLVLPFAVLSDGWGAMTGGAALLAAVSGVAFALGAYGLYRAFAIGPVRLVAPAVAAYPILSVGWAAASGTPVPPSTWLAVLAIVGGVGVVAALSDDAGRARGRRSALGWAALGATGFAATFALGQAAALAGAEMPVVLLARLAAVATVLGLALARREGVTPRRAQVPILVAMGALDALALGAVTIAGARPDPEHASIASSLFGLVTVILAWAVLRERMAPAQWAGVALVFAGVAKLAA